LRLSCAVRTPIQLAAACILAWLSLSGCERGATSSEPPVSSCVDEPTSLHETFDCLREWYARGSYTAMRPYIDPTCRDDVIDLLIAVDELLAANAGALGAIREACPRIDLTLFDMSALQNEYLDLFSRDVRVIRLAESDGRGTVTVQIGPRLPLAHLRFQQRQGRWIYVPGETAPELVGRLRGIARAWDRLTLVVSARPHSAEEIMHEYRLRIQPKLKLELTNTNDRPSRREGTGANM